MSGTAYQTLRARKPFCYRGVLIEAGATVTLPVTQARRLKERRCLDHLLVTPCRLYAQHGIGKEYFFNIVSHNLVEVQCVSR